MSTNGESPKEIKVGVIGCGRIGLVHLGAITKAPNVTPVIVSNPTISKAEAGTNKNTYIGKLLQTRSYQNYDETRFTNVFV